MNDSTQENAFDYDPRTETSRIIDHGEGSLCTTIVSTIADRTGIEPTDMVPLYSRIDPELIDRMCQGGPEISGEIMFDYHGFRVTVTSDRQILITPITADDTESISDSSEHVD